jgi:hypothetical protein
MNGEDARATIPGQRLTKCYQFLDAPLKGTFRTG